MKFSKPRHHSDPSYRRDKVRLARFLEREFGVFIVEVGWEEMRLLELLPDFSSAPFEPNKLGVFGSQKIIVATADAPMSGFTHEAGHMVACPETSTTATSLAGLAGSFRSLGAREFRSANGLTRIKNTRWNSR